MHPVISEIQAQLEPQLYVWVPVKHAFTSNITNLTHEHGVLDVVTSIFSHFFAGFKSSLKLVL
jgi:hypothetical protein